MEVYDGRMDEKTLLRKIIGSVGNVLHEWNSDAVVLRWKTDGGTIQGGSMTAYVDLVT